MEPLFLFHRTSSLIRKPQDFLLQSVSNCARLAPRNYCNFLWARPQINFQQTCQKKVKLWCNCSKNQIMDYQITLNMNFNLLDIMRYEKVMSTMGDPVHMQIVEYEMCTQLSFKIGSTYFSEPLFEIKDFYIIQLKSLDPKIGRISYI